MIPGVSPYLLSGDVPLPIPKTRQHQGNRTRAEAAAAARIPTYCLQACGILAYCLQAWRSMLLSQQWHGSCIPKPRQRLRAGHLLTERSPRLIPPLRPRRLQHLWPQTPITPPWPSYPQTLTLNQVSPQHLHLCALRHLRIPSRLQSLLPYFQWHHRLLPAQPSTPAQHPSPAPPPTSSPAQQPSPTPCAPH
jgi:hypothetical protein